MDADGSLRLIAVSDEDAGRKIAQLKKALYASIEKLDQAKARIDEFEKAAS